MSKWRPVTDDVFSQGMVLGSVLFHVFVHVIDSGFECTLSRSADDPKLCGAADTLERRGAIQRDFDRLERWDCVNLMKYNKAKYKVLHLSQGKHKHKHRLGEEWIESSSGEMTGGS